MSLKSFYEQEAGELKTDDTVPALPAHGYKEAKKTKEPISRLLILNKEIRRLDEDRRELSQLLEAAKGGVGDKKDGAIAQIVERFGKMAKKLRVFFPEPLLGPDGNRVDKVAMKVITSEAQLEKLKSNVEIAKEYFPNLEFRMMKDARNRDVAVVFGVDAMEFNAVVTAEKVKQQMEQRAQQLDADYKNANAELSANVASANAKDSSAKVNHTQSGKQEPALG